MSRARAALHRVVGFAAAAFVAGPLLEDALLLEQRLRGQGLNTTIGYWNSPADPPEAVDAEAHAAVLALAQRQGVQLSIKAPEHTAGGLATLAGGAVPLHFDALAPDTADATLQAAADAGGGVTLPGRWRRSEDDAAQVTALGLPARVVKGQWADPSDPRRDPVAGFLRVVDRLAGASPHVAVATHDPRLAAEAIGRLLRAGTSCELQLLYGLPPDGALRVARRAGVPARAYVPYGQGYLPYATSTLMRNPRLTLTLAHGLRRSGWRLE